MNQSFLKTATGQIAGQETTLGSFVTLATISQDSTEVDATTNGASHSNAALLS